MVLPRSTNNSLAAGFVSTTCTSSPSSSAASVVVTAGTSSSLSDEIASAVATALGNSLVQRDWAKMNLDLYNFHLRSPARSPNQQFSIPLLHLVE